VVHGEPKGQPAGGSSSPSTTSTTSSSCAGQGAGVEGERPTWDAYFMELAAVVAKRSTCPRRHVGAVLVRDRRILATGYNGAPPGFPHCTDVGCLMQDGHCVRTIHAEANAILQAALHGVTVRGSTLYTTATPCLHCAKLLIGAGVVRVVYRDWYPDPRAVEFLQTAGIPLERCRAGAPS